MTTRRVARWTVLLVVVVLFILPPGSAAAGGSWYLVAPPWFKPLPAPLLDAPLSDWERVRAFDSAEACEAGRQERITRTEANAWRALELDSKARRAGRSADVQKDMEDLALEATIEARWAQALLCVASDDPRLRGR